MTERKPFYNRPCKNCGKPVFTDSEDFWRFDPDIEKYRMVDYKGDFYPLDTHPATTEQRLVEYYGDKIKLAKETDIMWRTLALVVDALVANRML